MLCDNVAFVSAGIFSTEKKGWLHPVQKLDCDELIYVTKGVLFICEDYSEYEVEAGDVIWLKKGHIHYGCNENTGELSFNRLVFSGWEEHEATESGIYLKKLSVPDDADKFDVLWRQLMDCITTPEYPSCMRDYYTRLLILELAISGHDILNGTRIQFFISDWIKNEAPSGVKVSDVAAHFGYSEDYITRIFKKYYAKGLKNYINAVRICKIKKRLLNTSMSCAEIAKVEGFSTTDAFYKFFKFQTNMNVHTFRLMYTGVGNNFESGTAQLNNEQGENKK